MSIKEQLFAFEERYPFLYEEMVNGVSVYTCLRDSVAARLESELQEASNSPEQKGKVYLRRIFDTFLKWRKYRKAETVIFTSSVYRRDKGRNLAAEFLLQKYPNGVIFEWPSRHEAFDKAYFKDKSPYVALDGYLLRYKLYCKLHKKEMQRMEEECRARLTEAFAKNPPQTDAHKRAVDYLLDALPNSIVATTMSQRIFARMLRKYKNIKYAVDFWGSGRENIIPVLHGNPESIELQHGIITPLHPGYVYPSFVKQVQSTLFERKILVYTQRDKDILCKQSIYDEAQIEIVGNPRIQRYKQLFVLSGRQKKWILFSSQPYEQDQAGVIYYEKMLPYLKRLAELIDKDGKYTLAIKLHPRENDGIKALYQKAVPSAKVFGSDSQLYELLSESYLHVTATSTVLFEALEFDVPTITLQFENYTPREIFGKDTFHVIELLDMDDILHQLMNEQEYQTYLANLHGE